MKRLTEEHPLTKKLRALEAFMDENKIEVRHTYNGLVVFDRDTEVEGLYRDTDIGDHVDTIPYFCETMLILNE